MNARRHALVLLAVAGSMLSACSHTIESPEPTSSSVAPDLVCNAKPVDHDLSTVVLSGDGFTPMPSKTLESQRQLLMPKIELTQAKDLAGADVSGAAVQVPDDPSSPATSAVHWTSEQSMSFDVRPGEKWPEGVYSITVTNPDGQKHITFDQALAIIPPPIVSALKPPAICDDQADQTIDIEGDDFLEIDGALPSVQVGDETYTPTKADGCTKVAGNFVEKDVEICKSLTITIPKGDFTVTEKTDFAVVVTNPAPANCASSNEVKLTVEPPPKVDAVVPATVCQGGSQLTITGSNFVGTPKVELRCDADAGGASVTASTVTVEPDGKTLTATFGSGATPGSSCDVVVTNPDGCEDRPLPHKTVTVTTGPILFYVDPEVAFNGVNTQITLFATTVQAPLPADAITMTPHGQSSPATTLPPIYPVPNHPNRVQAIVPKGQAPASYDVMLKDGSGCFATLPNALVVTDQATVTLKAVTPPFGWTNEDTAITIQRDTAAQAPNDKPFVATPRLFLNPANAGQNQPAIEVTSTAFVDPNTVTAVVPKGTLVNDYQLILVNPDGTVGVLTADPQDSAKAPYHEVQSAPPVIDGATPSSIVSATGQQVVLSGHDFASGDTVQVFCGPVGVAGTQANATSAAPTCNGTSCTQAITIDGSALASGDVCIVRVTNPDGSYGEYSAIGVTNASLNLSTPTAGPPMNVGRRALAAAAGNATSAARFVYAIGGDSGQASGALDSVEFAPVDLYGKIGAFTLEPQTATQAYGLPSKRTLAGVTTVGRYVYLVGGDDGAGPIDSAVRAMILSPREAPTIDDVDLALGTAGLADGEWHYRVSALFDAADPDNPGGESLASDEFTVKLPAIANEKISVTLVWKAPVDALGQALPNVVGYRIYRTAAANGAPGSEALLDTVNGASTLTYTDDGSKTVGGDTPLPTGSTGRWAQLPAMGAKRSGPAVASGFEPGSTTRFYVYALLGKSAPTTAVASYEYLSVDIAPNGRQTVAASWTAGASQSAQARWQLGAWVATRATSSTIAAGDTWIFLGGGLDGNGTLTGKVEAGKIGAGGDLGALGDTPKDFSATAAGYGVCAANDQLFVFGGQGAGPFTGAKSANLVAPPPTLANNSWNSEGLTMKHGRYLMGSAVQSSFIFLLGGETDEPSPASKTIELVIW